MIDILIVDDEFLEREALKTMLYAQDENISICAEANNGKPAVKLAKELLPDITFMDTKLPVLDGIQATKQIKAKNPQQIVFLMCTYDEDRRETIPEYVDDYLVKPIRPTDLKTVLAKYKKMVNMPPTKGQGLFENLLTQIQLENFREAKEALAELINKLAEQYRDNPREYRNSFHLISDRLRNICEEKNIFHRINE